MNDRLFKQILTGRIALLLIFTPLARGAAHLWSMTVAFIAIYFLIFLWFWKLSDNTGGAPVLKISLIDRLIIAFLALAAVSAVFSVYKHDSIYALLQLTGYAGIYYLVVCNFDAMMKKWILILVVAMGACLSVYGLLQYIGVLDHSWWFPQGFLASSYVNHNHFAGYLELVVPVAIGMLARKREESFYSRILLLAALCVMIIAFIFTQSRGGWISLALSLMVMNIILIKRGVLNKMSFLVFILIAASLLVFFSIKGAQMFPSGENRAAVVTEPGKDISLQTRLGIWRGSVKELRGSLLTGTGIGDFDKGFYRYRPEGYNEKAVYAHNEYLHIAVEMGVLAPLLMVLLFIAILKTGLRTGADLAMVGCCCGMLSLALHGLVDFNFHVPANMLLFCIYGAFVREG